MEYMLAIYADETLAAGASPERLRANADAFAAFVRDIADRGILRGRARLAPTATATAVRVRDGETLTIDGPFAETKEQLAGFFVVECADLDEAIAVAARIPAAGHGTIEVRPLEAGYANAAHPS